MCAFRRTTFNATRGVGPDRSASWLDTVDQVFGTKTEKWPRAERNQSAIPATGSRSQVQRGRWRQPIQRASLEVPTCGKTTRTSARSRSRGFRRFERSRGHHVARIIEDRTSCSSGSAVGCATCTVRAVRNSCAVDCIGRGTSQIGVRVGRRSGTSAAVASRSCSEAPGSKPDGASASARLGSTIAVTRDSVAGREDSVGSKAIGRGVAGLSARAGVSLVADRGSVGSDTTMAVVGVTGPSSDRMAALIEEVWMKRRKMEAASNT